MTKDSSFPTHSTLGARFAELGLLERQLIEQDALLREEQRKTRALAKENRNLRKRLDAHLSASKSRMAILAKDSEKQIGALEKSLRDKENQRFEFEQRLLEASPVDGNAEHFAPTIADLLQGSNLPRNGASGAIGGPASEHPLLSFDERAALALRKGTLTTHLMRSGEEPAALGKGWLSEFPNLSSAKGFLFAITYPYSGASSTIATINGHENIHISGNIGRPLVSLARAHTALQHHASVTASGQFLQHEMLGWRLAECFVRNMITPMGKPGISGFTLSYLGHDRNELLNTLLFLYSYFPNVRFVFVSGSPGEISKKHTPPTMTPEKMNKRIQHLNRSLTQFSRAFADVCMIQSPKSSSTPKLGNFLAKFKEETLRQSGSLLSPENEPDDV